MGDYVNLVEVAQIPLDRGLTVRTGGREIAVFNLAGEIMAIDGRCPHRGGPLGEGFTEDGHVYCPLHGWKFEVKTGACVNNPGKAVRCFPVRVVDGMVQAQLDN